MGPIKYLLSGLVTLSVSQAQLFAVVAAGLDVKGRFVHRAPWVLAEEWRDAMKRPRETFQIQGARIMDPNMNETEVLNSLPLLQKMSTIGEEKFKRATANNPLMLPTNTLTQDFSLGTSADTKLSVMVSLGRSCLNLPLFRHTGSKKVKDGILRHHSVHSFASVDLKSYAYERYQEFLGYQKASEMGFENGEFCSTVLIALVNAQDYQFNTSTQEVLPKWSEYRWKQKSFQIRPFAPRYEEQFYGLLQTIYSSLGSDLSNTAIELTHAKGCIKKREHVQEEQMRAKQVRMLKNTIPTIQPAQQVENADVPGVASLPPLDASAVQPVFSSRVTGGEEGEASSSSLQETRSPSEPTTPSVDRHRALEVL